MVGVVGVVNNKVNNKVYRVVSDEAQEDLLGVNQKGMWMMNEGCMWMMHQQGVLKMMLMRRKGDVK